MSHITKDVRSVEYLQPKKIIIFEDADTGRRIETIMIDDSVSFYKIREAVYKTQQKKDWNIHDIMKALPCRYVSVQTDTITM